MNLKETVKKILEDKNSSMLIENMKRRADRGLIEGITADDIENAIREIESRDQNLNMSYTQTMYELSEAIDNFGYLDEAPVALDESVTFIDNAGNLKTMSTEDYVKDQHEYHTETQIANFDKKKRKKIDYKLISESEFKKLSEMSIEEILNEADNL